MSHPAKTIAILGATGNQGSSIAHRFLLDPTYHVRALTRHPDSAAALALASHGAEITYADLDDPASLRAAFAGANVIFSVTNYWEAFFRPDCRGAAAERGISCREYAYHVEKRQRMNVADAAAGVVGELVENGFIVSTLSNARKCTEGRMGEVYHFDGKAEVFPDYVRERWPELEKKASYVQTGYFMRSWMMGKGCYFNKMLDRSFEMRFTTDPDKVAPHLDVNRDMGNFVYAVAQRSPGGHYMAAGEFMSWADFMKTWLRITGKEGRYEQVTAQQMIDGAMDPEFGREIAEMFSYTSDPGYDGGKLGEELITAEAIRREGIDCPMTSWETYCEEQDWSGVWDGTWA